MEIIKNQIEKLRALCEKHNVKNLFVFGSIANQKASKNSDIGFLVEFDNPDPLEYFNNYLSLKSELETLFSKKVDLVEVQTLTNPILKRSIEKDKIKVYGREDIEMAL